ncbi:MAG: 2OG-Fe(II) oxygenase family protein [Nanoarchaeota archaeon]|nr:2OG-Fe(II) oxygenase family protein [Nanoarchaeota archaeon]
MINKMYLDDGVIDQIADAFTQQGFIRLEKFLNEKEYIYFINSLNSADSKIEKVPDRYSYSLIECDEIIFGSVGFKELLSKVVGKKVGKMTLSVKRFGWKDYTLVHDDEAGKEEMRFFFILADKWNVEWGGNVVYMAEDGLGNPIIFPITGNSLCIVKKKKDMHSFVKYVNNLAGKNSFVVVEGKIK